MQVGVDCPSCAATFIDGPDDEALSTPTIPGGKDTVDAVAQHVPHDVFVDVDDLGNAFELNDGVVPAGMEERAQLIIDNCPEFAIAVIED